LKIKLEEIKEPRFFFLHSYHGFSFLLSAISCLVSMFLLLDWRAADHVFISSFQRKTAGASWSQLWKERKELYHPLINGISAKNQNRNQNISVSFLRFYTANQQGFASQN
jgi:hypothetical protein